MQKDILIQSRFQNRDLERKPFLSFNQYIGEIRMKYTRIILIILIIIWMAIIFKFSHQPGGKSQGTSSSVTKFIVKIFYGEGEKAEEKVKKLDPIIRKLAHYTVYLVRRYTYCRSFIYI